MNRPEHPALPPVPRLPLRRLAAALGVLALLLAMRPASAQYYDPQHIGEPPPGAHQHFTSNEWKVKPMAEGTHIKGTITLDCYKDQKDELILRLKGLERHKVYSVWLLRKEGDSFERAGVPQGWEGPSSKDFKVRVEPSGIAYYRGCLSACPLGYWKTLEIRYHPDGNASDLQTSVIVVQQKLKPQ